MDRVQREVAGRGGAAAGTRLGSRLGDLHSRLPVRPRRSQAGFPGVPGSRLLPHLGAGETRQGCSVQTDRGRGALGLAATREGCGLASAPPSGGRGPGVGLSAWVTWALALWKPSAITPAIGTPGEVTAGPLPPGDRDVFWGPWTRCRAVRVPRAGASVPSSASAEPPAGTGWW